MARVGVVGRRMKPPLVLVVLLALLAAPAFGQTLAAWSAMTSTATAVPTTWGQGLTSSGDAAYTWTSSTPSITSGLYGSATKAFKATYPANTYAYFQVKCPLTAHHCQVTGVSWFDATNSIAGQMNSAYSVNTTSGGTYTGMLSGASVAALSASRSWSTNTQLQPGQSFYVRIGFSSGLQGQIAEMEIDGAVYCGGLTLQPHASSTNCLQTGSTAFGTTCSVACDGGYNTWPGNLLCGSGGLYAGNNATCTRKPCPNLAWDASVDGSNCNGLLFQDTCNVSCQYDYYAVGSTQFQCTCGSTCVALTNVNPSSPFSCVGNPCPPITLPALANITTYACVTGPVPSGMTCANLTCPFGYTVVGGRAVVCNLGFYNRELGSCAAVSNYCPVLPVPGNGTKNACSRQIGGSCGFGCNIGYVNSTSLDVTCVADTATSGVYSSATPSCDVDTMFCGAPVAPGNGSIGACSRALGGKCNFLCNSGFFQTALSRTCLVDRTYSDAPVACRLNLAYCPTPTAPAFGTILAASRYIGGKLTYSCEPGYINTTATTLTCLAGGTFGGTPGCTPLNNYCPPLDVPVNGAMGPCSTMVGGRCEFTCSSNFACNQTVRVCRTDGSWSGTNVTCSTDAAAPNCKLPNAPFNGVRGACGQTSGNTCSFSCNPGYIITNPSTTCVGPGYSATPSCAVDNSFCPSFTLPSKGVQGTCSRAVGGTCSLSCSSGYDASVSAVTCLTTGAWSQSSFTCSPQACAPPPIAELQIIATCDQSLSGTCGVACAIGYAPMLNTHTCVVNGSSVSFNGSYTACNISTDYCPIPSAPGNASVGACDQSIGGRCTIVCDAGFVGGGTYTCTALGFSGTIHNCDAIDPYCDRPSDPVNGQVNLAQCATTVGGKCFATCLDGYIPAGTGFVRCNVSGVFSQPPLQCLHDLAYCAPADTLLHGSITSCDRSLGGACYFQCDPGYFITPTFVQTCTNNHTFGGPEITCQPTVPAQLSFQQIAPGVSKGGAQLSPQPQIRLEDVNRQLVLVGEYNITVSLAVGPGPLRGTLTQRFTAGLASFTDLALDTASPPAYGLLFTASVGGYTLSATVTVDAGPGAVLELLVPPSTGAISGVLLASQPVVVLRDLGGNLADSDNPCLITAEGEAEVFSTQFIDGVAQFTTVVLRTAGTTRLRISTGALFIVSADVVVSPGPPSQLGFLAQPASSLAGSAFSAIHVAVLDAQRNQVPGYFTIDIAIKVGNGDLYGTLEQGTSNGSVAVFDDLHVIVTGTKVLQAALANDPNISAASNVIDVYTPYCDPSTHYAYDTDGFAVCVACEPGTVQPSSSQPSCSHCPDDYYSLPNRIDCTPCPVGGNCSDHTRKSMTGWWIDPSTASLYECVEPTGCPGGDAGVCADGYEGYLCGSCSDGYGRSGLKCSKCPSTGLSIFLLILWIVFVIIFVVYLNWSAYRVKDTSSQVMKVLLNFLQMTSLTGALAVQSKTALGDFTGTSSVSTISVNILPITCLFGLKFYSQFIIYAVLPILAILIPVVGHIIAFKRAAQGYSKQAQNQIKRHFINRCITMWIVMIFLLYPSVTRELLKVFECRADLGNVLIFDVSIRCYSGAHIAFVIIGVIGGVLYGLGVPVGGFIILFRLRKKLNEPHVRARYHLLFDGYKNSAFYWEFAIMARKTLLVLVLVIVTGALAQSLLALFLVGVALIVHARVRAYENDRLNDVELVSLTIVTATVLGAVATNTELGKGWTTFITVALIVINITFFVVVLAAYVRMARWTHICKARPKSMAFDNPAFTDSAGTQGAGLGADDDGAVDAAFMGDGMLSTPSRIAPSRADAVSPGEGVALMTVVSLDLEPGMDEMVIAKARAGNSPTPPTTATATPPQPAAAPPPQPSAPQPLPQAPPPEPVGPPPRSDSDRLEPLGTGPGLGSMLLADARFGESVYGKPLEHVTSMDIASVATTQGGGLRAQYETSMAATSFGDSTVAGGSLAVPLQATSSAESNASDLPPMVGGRGLRAALTRKKKARRMSISSFDGSVVNDGSDSEPTPTGQLNGGTAGNSAVSTFENEDSPPTPTAAMPAELADAVAAGLDGGRGATTPSESGTPMEGTPAGSPTVMRKKVKKKAMKKRATRRPSVVAADVANLEVVQEASSPMIAVEPAPPLPADVPTEVAAPAPSETQAVDFL